MRLICTVNLLLLLVSSAAAADMEVLKDAESYFSIYVNNATVADSERVLFINAGMDRIADDLRCIQKKDTVVTSNGQSDYSVNDNCLRNGVRHVELKARGMRYGLERVSPEDIGKLCAENEGGGKCPCTYYEHQGILTVFPEGTAKSCTLIVTYEALPDYMSSDSDSMDIPRQYGWLGVMAGAIEYLNSVEQTQKAANLEAVYLQQVARKRDLLIPGVTVREQP